jgi:hypothetical protein
MDLRGELVTVHDWSPSAARYAVSILLDPAALGARRAVARGSLAPLARGLRAELAPVLCRRRRDPGRKGAALADRRAAVRTTARCCGSIRSMRATSVRRAAGKSAVSCTTGFRPYWYPALARRASASRAVLGVLLDDAECCDAAWRVLDGYADRYLDYPNRDNVLGPSRPFFSTYLESIWLLQLVLGRRPARVVLAVVAARCARCATASSSPACS